MTQDQFQAWLASGGGGDVTWDDIPAPGPLQYSGNLNKDLDPKTPCCKKQLLCLFPDASDTVDKYFCKSCNTVWGQRDLPVYVKTPDKIWIFKRNYCRLK